MKEEDLALLNSYFPETMNCPKCGKKLIRNEKNFNELKDFFNSKKEPKIEFSLVLYNITVPYVCDNCGYDTKMSRHGLSI